MKCDKCGYHDVVAWSKQQDKIGFVSTVRRYEAPDRWYARHEYCLMGVSP